MPKVPTYDNFQTSVQPSNGARVQAQNTGAIGAAGAKEAVDMGQALSHTGDVLGAVVQERQAMVNEADVKKLDVETNSSVRDLLHHPETGYLNQLGGNALKNYDTVKRTVTDVYDKAGAALTSPDAQRMWNDLKARRLEMAMGEIDEHDSKQRTVYAIGQSEARISDQTSDMAVNYSDPAKYSLAKNTLISEVDHQADLKGVAPEVRTAMKEEALTKAHLTVIDGMMAKDQPTLALNYYKDHKDDISPDQRPRIEKVLSEASSAAMAVSTVDDLWKTVGPKGPNDPVDLEHMDEQLRETFKDNPLGLKAAREELHTRASEHDYTQREVNASAKLQVIDMLLSGKSLGAVRSSSAWASLPADDRMQIQEHQANLAAAQASRAASAAARVDAEESRAERQKTRNGYAAYLGLSDPTRLRTMSETQIRAELPVLGNELTAHLLEQKRALVNGAPKLDTDDFNYIARRMGLNPDAKMKSDDQKARLGMLKMNIEQAITTSAQTGKVLTRPEILDLGLKAASHTITVNSGFGTAPAYAATLTDKDLSRVHVPPSELPKLKAALAQLYKQDPTNPDFAPSADNIRKLYVHKEASSF